MQAQKTWLEVALNGPWGRGRQPRIPVAIKDIVDEAVACAQAGAAVIHAHAYDEVSGKPKEDADIYSRIIEGIRSRADVIVYPTIPSPGLGAFPADASPAQRFDTMETLARRGLLEWAAIDPGSTNIALYDDLREDRTGVVYLNSELEVRHALGLAARYRFHPSYAIYEPGFVRLGATLHWRCSCPAPIYRFMFSSDYTFGFPPDDFGLTAYLNLLDRVAPGARWMIAGLGVDIRALMPRAIAEAGHVRVGLEDVSFGCERSNVEQVEEAARMIEECGNEVATTAEIRAELDAVEMGD
jgi:3-keto-5-aminohexanoate cleavage enzyme